MIEGIDTFTDPWEEVIRLTNLLDDAIAVIASMVAEKQALLSPLVALQQEAA
jgi:hypothetical protein